MLNDGYTNLRRGRDKQMPILSRTISIPLATHTNSSSIWNINRPQVSPRVMVIIG